ncbi:MAG: hypothetical protein EAZ57_05815 [Cytophagales bacterium]|nr:MAG: hypothetical protein EAZ67_06720 [Cytophagales bacterium]TAF60868.1 MAG: hypothetical protein EAZ57_05815 [Cytophagales bacterium]
MFVVDIINFNADASCLTAKRWLEMLTGNKKSEFYRWIELYVFYQRKVVLGFPGATVADVQCLCPEAWQLVNDNSHLFEVLLRPYSHDLAVLRTDLGFEENCKVGFELIQKTFKKVSNWFLPPEFMLTSSQLVQLKRLAVEGVFINPGRFKGQRQDRLAKTPYLIQTFDNELFPCIPFSYELTKGYLNSLHTFSAEDWNIANSALTDQFAFGWRDGESPFFIPDGLLREETWLRKENIKRSRVLLSEALLLLKFVLPHGDAGTYTQYPAHTLMPWMREMRMLGFVQDLWWQEQEIAHFDSLTKFLWLQSINSDILSAIEKDSPQIQLKALETSSEYTDFTIWRSERGTEGEEFLWLLKQAKAGQDLEPWLKESHKPHLIKLKNRLKIWKDGSHNHA